MHYPPWVYPNQDDLSRFHHAQHRGYGGATEYLHTSSGVSNSRMEQEKPLRFNSWGLPLDSPLANTLTDDDFLNMVVAYLLVIYAENCIRLQSLVRELDIFVNHVISWIKDGHGTLRTGNLVKTFVVLFNLSYFIELFLIHITYISQASGSGSNFALYSDVTGTSLFMCCLIFDKVL